MGNLSIGVMYYSGKTIVREIPIGITADALELFVISGVL